MQVLDFENFDCFYETSVEECSKIEDYDGVNLFMFSKKQESHFSI